MARSVIYDVELSAVGKVVFCELALWCRRGEDRVSRGQRAIASSLGLHQETVMKALRELAERGHVRIESGGRGKRASYVLLSFVYREPEKRQRRKAA